MFRTGSFGVSNDVTLEKSNIITITQKTIIFSGKIYQTKNIEKFSIENEIIVISSSYVIILIFFSSLLLSLSNGFNNIFLGSLGLLQMLLALASIFINTSKISRNHGFLITSISGEKILFPSGDKVGLKEVLSAIRDLIETEKNSTLEITITESRINVISTQGNFEGNIATKISGDVNIFIQAEERLAQKDDN